MRKQTHYDCRVVVTTYIIFIVVINVTTLTGQMWSPCPCKCGHTARVNVVTLPVQMWSHCPGKCGHTVRTNVITLSGQMWSHCPVNCDHTVRSTVITLTNKMWSHWPNKCDHTDRTRVCLLNIEWDMSVEMRYEAGKKIKTFKIRWNYKWYVY